MNNKNKLEKLLNQYLALGKRMDDFFNKYQAASDKYGEKQEQIIQVFLEEFPNAKDEVVIVNDLALQLESSRSYGPQLKVKKTL